MPARLAACVAALIGAAVLAFPEPVARVAPWLPAMLAVLALSAGVWCLRDDRPLAMMTGVFAVAVVAGWIAAAPLPGVLSHFTNAALGVLILGVVATVGRSPERLRLLAVAWVALIAIALIAGASSTVLPASKFFPVSPVIRADGTLPLPGMLAGGMVNRNVVGILAVMSLPMTLALVRLTTWRWPLYGLASLALGLGLVTQSLSAWMAAAVVGLMVVLPRAWRWSRALATAALAVPVACVIALYTLSPPPAADGVVPTLTPTGVTVTSVESPVPSVPAVRLTENPVGGAHGVVGDWMFPPGYHVVTTFVQPGARPGVWMRAASNGARFDLGTGAIDDYGTHTAWVERDVPARGWLAVRHAFTTTGGTLPVGVVSLERFPRSVLYDGAPASSVVIAGPVVLHAATPWNLVRIGAVVMRGSVAASLDARLQVWRAAWAIWRESLWSGIGLYMFRHVYEAPMIGDSGVEATAAHAHNIVLQTGLDLGLPGLLAYLALLWLIGRRAWRAVSRPSVAAATIGAAAGLVVVAAHVFGAGDAIALGAKVGGLVWMAMGLVVAASERV